jgi:hypothetical protein
VTGTNFEPELVVDASLAVRATASNRSMNISASMAVLPNWSHRAAYYKIKEKAVTHLTHRTKIHLLHHPRLDVEAEPFACRTDVLCPSGAGRQPSCRAIGLMALAR